MAEHESSLSKLRAKLQGASASLPAELNRIPHSLRTGAAQLTSANPASLKIQLVVKEGKGVVVDEESLGRELKGFSKAMYNYSIEQQGVAGQVMDDVAFLLFKEAELHEHHARSVDVSRNYLKDIRNFEDSLVSTRKSLSSLQDKLASFTKSHPKPTKVEADAVAQMRSDISHLVDESALQNNSLATLKTAKLFESFSTYHAAQKELGEKLVMLSGYGDVVLLALDGDGSDAARQRSAKLRLDIDAALKAWTPTQSTSHTAGSTGLAGAHAGTTTTSHLPPVEHHNPFADSHSPPALPARHSDDSKINHSAVRFAPSPVVTPTEAPLRTLHSTPPAPEYPVAGVPPVTIAETGQVISGSGGPQSGSLARGGGLPAGNEAGWGEGGGQLPAYGDAQDETTRADDEAQRILVEERERKQAAQ